MILVWLMAAFDVLARVCHVVFGITGSHRTAGWQKEVWIREVAVHNATLAELFTDGRPGDSVMTLLSKLRNNIHGEAVSATGLIPVIGPHALETFMALPTDDRDEIVAAVERVGGHAAWGVDEPLTGYDLQIQPGKFVERLLAESIYLMNQIMTITPVETLEGIEHPENLAHPGLPLSLSDIRLIWQLGLDSPIAAA